MRYFRSNDPLIVDAPSSEDPSHDSDLFITTRQILLGHFYREMALLVILASGAGALAALGNGYNPIVGMVGVGALTTIVVALLGAARRA